MYIIELYEIQSNIHFFSTLIYNIDLYHILTMKMQYRLYIDNGTTLFVDIRII